MYAMININHQIISLFLECGLDIHARSQDIKKYYEHINEESSLEVHIDFQ